MSESKSPRVSSVVRQTVRSLLERSAAFHALPAEQRQSIARDMMRVAGYLVDADGATRKQALRVTVISEGVEAMAGLISAVDFPAFVRGLIEGVFDSIVDSSIQQMKAYGALLKAVARSVEKFAKDNVAEANRFLLDNWPGCYEYDRKTKHIHIKPDCLRSKLFHLSVAEGLPIDLKQGRATAERVLFAAKTHVALQRQRQALRRVNMGIDRIVGVTGRSPVLVNLSPVEIKPSVYIEEVPPGTVAIAGFETGITAFLGSGAAGRALPPTLIESFAAFEEHFGALGNDPDSYYLASAARGFFQNGGTKLYIAAVPPSSGTEVTDADLIGSDGQTGLSALAGIDGISLLAAPGVTSETVQRALIEQCEQRRDRIALLDVAKGLSVDEAIAARQLRSSHAVLYYPWLQVRDSVSGRLMLVPPAGHVAGWYAAHGPDRPRSATAALRGVEGVEGPVSTAQSARLLAASINPLRMIVDRGLTLAGGRTLSDEPEWKYVNVRRLMTFLERSIQQGLQWTVFEPNGEGLWNQVRRSIEDFLLNQWSTGSLMGDKADQAFFVRCDRSTMTQDDITNGRLVIIIGVAPLRPSEYVIIRINCLNGNCR